MLKKRILSFGLFLCTVFLMGAFAGITVYADDSESTQALDVYYSREALKSLPNSEALLFAYDSITEGVENSLPEITIYNGKDVISIDEVSVVFDAYIRDHTEHFWLGRSYSYSYNDETVRAMTPTYILEGDELTAAREEFDNAISEFLGYVNSSMDDYKKELILHDKLASHVVYVEEEHAHDAYGALVEGKAVCEGYAKALQCLLHKAGIQSLLSLGSSINPSTNLPEGHAWNIVRTNGNYYNVDLTWNDQSSTLFHAYFNVSDSVITKDHTVTVPKFPLPECNSTDDNYFTREGGLITEYDVQSIADILKQNALIADVCIPNGATPFAEWFYSNISDIAEALGINGKFTYGHSQLGDEVILTIEACLHKSLIYVPEITGSCTTDAVTAHYVCDCGRYFYDASATSSVKNPQNLYTHAPGHSYTKKIEDDGHLREKGVNCLSHDTYFYECERCTDVSAEKYFESAKTGEHILGAPATTESAQLCTVCGTELAPKLHKHKLISVSKYLPDCKNDGKEGYYYCECGEYFEDIDATRRIEDINSYGILSASGHAAADEKGFCPTCNTLIDPINKFTVTIAIGAVGFIILVAIISAIVKKIKD